MILARDPMDELKRAFKLFAPEGKRITVDDLAKVAQDLGENLDHEELFVLSPSSPKVRQRRADSRTPHRKAMIDEFDLDEDGAINEKEFIRRVPSFSARAKRAQC